MKEKNDKQPKQATNEEQSYTVPCGEGDRINQVKEEINKK